jgi:hypothetical protein
MSNNGTLSFAVGNGSGFTSTVTSSSPIPLNSWFHLAVVRSGSTVTMYFNGTSVGSGSNSGAFGIESFNIASPQVANYNAPMYISNVRLVKGTAVYTGNFTPSTTPLTAIANTSLLTCQSNRFKDNSSNAFAITISGALSVQRFSPFSPSAVYSTSTIGGSGYFDGNGDYLNIATNTAFGFGTGDFTIEFWTLWGGTLNSLNGGGFVELRSAVAAEATVIYLSSSGAINFYDGPANVEVSSGITITRQWTHIALARAS